MSDNPSVIVAGARTPIGRLLGGLKSLSAADLGAVAIKGALEKAGVSGDQVDYVIMGQVILAGAGQNPARGASTGAGIPMNVPTMTINKVCLSGLNAIALADQLVRAGEVDIVVAGGMESMTQAPAPAAELPRGLQVRRHHARRLDGLRRALRPGHQAGDDQPDRLLQRRDRQASPARSRTPSPPSRTSARPPRRRTACSTSEIVPVTIASRRGDVVVSEDEGVRADTTVESLAGLRPVAKDGTITAGSASQISDGACAVVVMSKAKAEELGLDYLAEIGAHGMVAGPDSSLQLQPAAATAKALEKEGISAADLDLVEFNEAFAAVGIASANKLGIPATRSTSTVARSRSATRSACPAPAWSSTWRSSSSAAAAAPVRPRCAAAAARATP